MAKQRFISTSFWDDAWVQSLNISEKLLYLYLMTNPLTNIAGVYELTEKRIAFDTGFTPATITKVMKKFEKDGKAFFRHGYVILPNWPKHQHWNNRSKVKKGIDSILESTPLEVMATLVKVGYKYPLEHLFPEGSYKGYEGLSKGHVVPSCYIDTDLDSDSDTDIDLDSDIDTDTDTESDGNDAKKSESDEIPNPLDLLSPEYKETFDSFIAFRKEIKKPMTPKAVLLALKKLSQLPSDEKRIECIENSIMNGWQGIFPERIAQQSQRSLKPRHSTEPGNASVDDYNHER